ncbi:hypothetical protein PgNI_10108 [Pyricularia grisea]|uniref:Uncharacterized protein n=1 Tax=Pyricularia grisea TaxID=148305 RepID=A0A6P8AYM4_PYRGI|nr:hypothetical protein PgNI_10108 [Pyricularia grisea]TLD07394.1 hypothetical protein PgNI_10108 [Pyricularia grisea]
MASEPASLRCEHCGETFLRKEHRDRHLRRHSGIKPFQCDVCDKSFARKDTLLRHSTIHRHGDETHGSTPRRCAQACISCAKLKQRCRGGLPCARCQDTGAECKYSPGKTPGIINISSARPSETPASRSGSLRASSIPTDQDNSDAYSYTPRSHVANGHPPNAAADQPALHHNFNSSASNSQDNPKFSHTAAGHPVAVSTNFNPSSLHSDPDLYTREQWSSSPSHHANQIVNEFAAEWDALSSYFPFLPISEELGDALETTHVMIDHNQQRSVEPHNHSPNHQMRGQAAPVPSVSVPNHSSDQDPSPPAVNSSRSYGETPCRRFPKTQDSHLQTAETETFGHVGHVPSHAYEGLRNFYAAQSQDSTPSFVPIRLIKAFVDLYFEYFDPQFPFLHVSHLEAEDLPWILLLATAAIGSYYSELDDIQDYTSILCDLLGRAVESEAMAQIKRPSKALIQSTFLRHIHLLSCGLHKGLLLSHYKRQMLMSMCRDMASRRDAERTSRQNLTKSNDEWASWLAMEEETRLVCCIYNFNLFDISKQMPCPSRTWYAKDVHEWRSKQMEFQAVRLQQASSQEPAPPPEIDCDPFLSKMSLVALYNNGKNNQRQRRASRLAMNSFGSHLRSMSPSISKAPIRISSSENDDETMENSLLDESIDHISFLIGEEPTRCHATLHHILAILRSVPLRTLFAGTGWQADTAQVIKLKAEFKEYLQREGARSRKCLWHAACISKFIQTTRRLAPYDMFSIGIATCYIVLYMELRPVESHPSQATPAGDASSRQPGAAARRRTVRLDQLSTREEVQDWARNGGDADIHLTNVGILREPDSLTRFLRMTEKALLRQVAWSAFFRAWAKNMVQLIHGEKPTLNCEDYNEAEQRIS